MALSNPFEKLPAELTTMIVGHLESTDIQSLINADPHMLRVFLQHELVILRPLRRSIYRQFPGPNLAQAFTACRLRQLESTPVSRDRAKYQEVVTPILTQPPETLPVTKLNLGAISDLYRLFCEAEVFTSAYSKEAWEMTQDTAAEYDYTPFSELERLFDAAEAFTSDYSRVASEMTQDAAAECDLKPKTELAKFPLSMPLSKYENEDIQKAYLQFESCRHTLWFSTSFLQDYYCPEKPASFYHIPWEFTDGNKLLHVRAFHAVLRFLLGGYERLLYQVDDLIASGSSNITSRRQIKEFVHRPSHDNLQFPAFLCSQGYRPLLNSQEVSNITESVISLYTRYSHLKENRQTCPLVVIADLEDSVKALFAGSQTERDFWTSGAFMFDCDRLEQLNEDWWFETVGFQDDAVYGVVDDYGNLWT